MLCVYTKEDRGFKSEVKQLLPRGGKLDMGHGSQYAKVMGTGVLHECNRFTCVVSGV